MSERFESRCDSYGSVRTQGLGWDLRFWIAISEELIVNEGRRSKGVDLKSRRGIRHC
jgi:hypothetical protein